MLAAIVEGAVASDKDVYDTCAPEAPENAIEGTPLLAASDAAPLMVSLIQIIILVSARIGKVTHAVPEKKMATPKLSICNFVS